MDTYMRNLNFVHQIAALNSLENRSELNDTGMFRAGNQTESYEDELVCPKPRRTGLSCCASELIKPLCQMQRSSRVLECEAGYEILEIFLNKGVCVDGEPSSFGYSPSFCSPPRRTSNPIIHDARFCKKTVSPMLFNDRKTSSGPSFSANPSVRIEGFECSMGESRCNNVHAFA